MPMRTITSDMFPMFVLIPDEGTVRVIENEKGLGYHEAFDLTEECYWVWTVSGDRYRLLPGEAGQMLLDPAPDPELQLFAIIAHWCLRWRAKQAKRSPRYLGDYGILARWLEAHSL